MVMGKGEQISFKIERHSSLPYYQQIKHGLVKRIKDGRWKAGDRLPSEDELIEHFEVSRTVIRQALNEMVHEGFLLRERGRGTFVAKTVQDMPYAHAAPEDLIQMLRHKGIVIGARVIEQELVPASSSVASQLEIAPMSPVMKLLRLWESKDAIRIFTADYVPYERCQLMIHVDFNQNFLIQYLERECKLTLVNSRFYLAASVANEYEANLFRMQRGTPIHRMRFIGYASEHAPFIFAHGVIRADQLWIEARPLDVIEMEKI